MANDVRINITAKDGASAAFVKIGQSADQMTQKVEAGSKRSAASMKQWGDAAFAVSTVIGTVALATSRLAADAEASNARMEQSFQNAGLAVEDYAAQIDNLMEKGLSLAFDDEDIAESLAALVDVTGDAEEAFRDLAIAQDIARARGISLEAATRLVIAAETGRLQSLQRMGIAVTSQMTSEEALGLLQTKYAGQAEAYAETTAASYERLGNTIENFGESVGDVANKALVPILALSTAVPVITSAASGLAGLAGGAAGLTALGAAIGTVGVATAALAAPIGIATYLFLDQKNVVARATEETLRNKQVLEEYVAYLESIDTPAEFIPEMSQDMKELLDWVTKAGDGVDTGLLNIGESTAFFSTNLGELNDAIRSLSPESLQAVLDFAEMLGVSFQDPNTWSPDAVNALAYQIVNLANSEELLQQETAAAQMAIVQQTIAMDDWERSTLDVANAYTSSLPVIQEWTRTAYESVGVTTEFGGAAVTAGKDLSYLRDQIVALGKSLKDATPAQTLDRVFGAIVGNTNAMVGSIDTAKKWADELIAPVGTYAVVDDLLAAGKITIEEYTAAQDAQIGITEDYNRALEASQVIQAKQAPLIAEQTDATADYLDLLSQQSAEEQQVALAWADADYAGRATEIANLAANYDTMTESQRIAFEDMITNAAAADPVLGAVLEDLGLITTTDGEVKINYDALGGANDATAELTEAINNLSDILAEIFDIQIDYETASGASTMLDVIARQMAELDGSTATVYINGQQIGFTPGDYATGGMVNVRLGELGPERLQFANGGMAIAPYDGNYLIPNGTYVSTAATTRAQSGPGGGGAPIHIQTVNMYPSTPDLHQQMLSTILQQGL